jgi:hypothetical protein
MPTTTRTVFEAMAPALDGVDLDEVFAPDGTLRTRCNADRHTATFAAWAWAVSDAAPMRPVGIRRGTHAPGRRPHVGYPYG